MQPFAELVHNFQDLKSLNVEGCSHLQVKVGNEVQLLRQPVNYHLCFTSTQTHRCSKLPICLRLNFHHCMVFNSWRTMCIFGNSE